MQERHSIREIYFNEQATTTQKHVLPFIAEVFPLTPGMRVLEIGCGEGGNLKPFLDMGCRVWGIDLAANKIADGEDYFAEHPLRENLSLKADNIFNLSPDSGNVFDLIFLRDTLEHIHNQDYFLGFVKQFIAPGGRLFLAFPPWRMPFGGHQQVCRNRFLSKLPWFHLLPLCAYKKLLKSMGEQDIVIEELLEVRETRINMQGFFKWIKKHNYIIVKQQFFLINPNYEIKFGYKTRKLPGWLNIPRLRDFFATTFYCVVAPENSKNNT